MILIISENNDQSTNHVIDWLDFLGCKNWKRINDTDVFHLKSFKISSENTAFYLSNQHSDLNLNNITAFWHRRGSIKITYPTLPRNGELMHLAEYLHFENKRISESILCSIYKNIRGIGNIYDAETNKLNNLDVASSIGLTIPNTLITNNREYLINFIMNHQNGVITKAMRHGSFFDKKNNLLMKGYTVLVDMEDALILPKSFAYSFFQERLDKLYEIRVFYLDGKCYSSAIFSQSDDKTKIDFRNYNRERPNRVIPIQLPLEIESKISLLMNKLNFVSGSLDFVYTTNKEFVFLEINPFGQFQQVSLPCNYFIEKEIANILIDYSNEHQ